MTAGVQHSSILHGGQRDLYRDIEIRRRRLARRVAAVEQDAGAGRHPDPAEIRAQPAPSFVDSLACGGSDHAYEASFEIVATAKIVSWRKVAGVREHRQRSWNRRRKIHE